MNTDTAVGIKRDKTTISTRVSHAKAAGRISKNRFMIKVALVRKNWNRIVEHLEDWRRFAIDLAASDSPKKTEFEDGSEEFTYEPIMPEAGSPGEPLILY